VDRLRQLDRQRSEVDPGLPPDGRPRGASCR
jgi:hypothetical protein